MAVSQKLRSSLVGRRSRVTRAASALLLCGAIAGGIASWNGPGVVHARTIPNTPTTGFMNPTTTTTSVVQNGQVDVVVDWAVPAGTMEGDTIRLELPASLRELWFQNFVVFHEASGRVLAEASLEREGLTSPANDRAWVVFTFTDVIEAAGAGSSGEARFSLSIEQSGLDFSTGDAEIMVYGLPVTVRPQPQNPFTEKTGTWNPTRYEATLLDEDGRLVQTSQHQRWAIAIRVDFGSQSGDDWTIATINEAPNPSFTTNCVATDDVFLDGFKLQMFQNGRWTDVPVKATPTATSATITSATCRADGSTSVVVEKLAVDVDRQYRIEYFTDLTAPDGRPVRKDEAGALVVGFPTEFRNDAEVVIGSQRFELSTVIDAEDTRAVGSLSNEPAIDVWRIGLWATLAIVVGGAALLAIGRRGA